MAKVWMSYSFRELKTLTRGGIEMNVMAKVKVMSEKIGHECSSFVIRYPRAYLATTALIGVLSLILFFAPEANAQLETQVTDALNPLARLLVGPVAKGLAIIGLFAFVGLLYAGRWMMAVSSLVAAVILGLLANIVTAIFQGSNAASFTLGG
jgi:type IV secretory pathway VirB2 component (pilin)